MQCDANAVLLPSLAASGRRETDRARRRTEEALASADEATSVIVQVIIMII